MKRRQFLATSFAAAPLVVGGMSLGLPKSRLFSAINSDPSDRVLVLINLTGGNDGLNTLVPLDQLDNLNAVRGNIMLPQNRLIGLNDAAALHPAMQPLRAVWDDARLGIVQSVGYPDQNRSHFRSSDIWNSASASNEYLRTGWLGRMFDLDHPNYPTGYPTFDKPHPAAISLGNSASETCQGLMGTFSQSVNNPLTMTSLLEGASGPTPDNEFGHELAYVRTTISQANAYGAIIQAGARAGRNVVDYPSGNPVATSLKYVAQMISGGLQTKVYVVSLGGFDTHANQVDVTDPTAGNHANLLDRLSSAIAAFTADIQALGLGERVVGMTYSEFGRRIRSNDALGTDHGSAAPAFLFGNCVNPGIVGQNPVIDLAVDEQEGVAMQYDFRDLYGSILEDWFGLQPQLVKDLLYAGYQRLPVLRNCSAPSATQDAVAEDATALRVLPTLFDTQTTVTFRTAKAGLVDLSVYDVQGALVEVLFSRRLPAGEQRVSVDTSAYPSGVIIFRLRENGRVRVVRAVKS